MSNQFLFHGLLTVRDEADILNQYLDHTLSWCDNIYVYDTGSTDGTWEILQEYAAAHPNIKLFRKESVCWHEGLRAVLFNEYRHLAKEGDWFARLDADEFYECTPRQFIADHVRWYESAIYLQWYEFRLTQAEAATLDTSQATLSEREIPIHLRRRHYLRVDYTEPRFFKYRKSMAWTPYASSPFNAGNIARARIPIRHYPHRDPIQLATRSRLRSLMRRFVSPSDCTHWAIEDWRSLIVDQNDPKLLFADSSTPLGPNLDGQYRGHRRNILMRSALYMFLVRLLDYTRPDFPSNYAAQPIPADVRALLEERRENLGKTN
jgi:hypothetical protein